MTPREELIALRRLAELEAKAAGPARAAAPREAAPDPSDGGSTLNFAGYDTGIPLPQGVTRALAGAGKAFSDTGLGVQQLASYVGLGDSTKVQREIDDAKARDKPLMDTGAGLAGNIGGNIAIALAPGGALGAIGKAAKVPSLVNAARAITTPKSLLGAAGVGAGFGAAQPVASDESRLQNMIVGGAGGAVVPAGVAGGKFVKNLIAPFTDAGAERIAGRALQRAAQNPASLQGTAQQFVRGSAPTTAEATGDIGLAQLQRTLANNADIGPAFSARAEKNTLARVAALEGVAGETGKREFFDAARSANAEKLYQKAFGESAKVTPWIKGEISKLQQRPAFRDAWREAETIARNEGIKLDRKNVVQVSHYAKKALDDAAENAAGNQQRAILATRDKLVSLMESKDFSPSYREARMTYASDSAPINQMDVGKALLDKFRPAIGEYGASNRANAAQFAQALRHGDETAAKATGFRGAKMDRVLTPQQLADVEGVAKDLGRAARAQDVGRATGSNTAQNLIAQDVLRQTLGPVGLPTSWAENALAQTLLRPVSWATKIPEQRTLKTLAEAMLDPDEAKRLMALAARYGKGGLLDAAIPYTVPVGSAGLLSLSQ